MSHTTKIRPISEFPLRIGGQRIDKEPEGSRIGRQRLHRLDDFGQRHVGRRPEDRICDPDERGVPHEAFPCQVEEGDAVCGGVEDRPVDVRELLGTLSLDGELA